MASADPITWVHTRPEGRPDFPVIVAACNFGKIDKTHPDGIRRRERVCNLPCAVATGPTKVGRADTTPLGQA